jgi:hypothetical protein
MTQPTTVAADPCCGTADAAQRAGACCDPAAKSEAVATGATCCGPAVGSAGTSTTLGSTATTR